MTPDRPPLRRWHLIGAVLTAVAMFAAGLWLSSEQGSAQNQRPSLPTSAAPVTPPNQTPVQRPATLTSTSANSVTTEILALLEQTTTPDTLEQLRGLLAKMEARDFPALLDSLKKHGRLGAQADWAVADVLFDAWAGQDARAALGFASQLMNDAPMIATAMITRVARKAGSDLPLLQEALAAIPPEGREEMTQVYLNALVEKQGMAEALRWAAAHPGHGAETHLIGLWAEQDSAAAFAWLQEKYPDGSTIPPESLTAAARPWIAAEPERAAQWLLTQPETAVPNSLFRDAFTTWVLKTPETLAEHLNQHPNMPQRDTAVECLVQNVTDPAKALEWASQIQDPGRRAAAQTGRLIYLARDDPDLYAAALASDIVMPEVKQKLRNNPPEF
jgi:hypothetical protein